MIPAPARDRSSATPTRARAARRGSRQVAADEGKALASPQSKGFSQYLPMSILSPLTAGILPVDLQVRGDSMSAVQATSTETHGASTAQAELAHKCLYYMLLMREVEDRIERKLYRQGKVVGGVY